MRVPFVLAAFAAGLSLPFGARAEPPVPVFDSPVKAAVTGSAATAGGQIEAAKPMTQAEKPKPVEPTLVARINLSSQRMEVLVGGASKHSWPISSGREGYASPRGIFRVQWTSRMWYSRKYDNAPMPHAVFFSGGVAVHGTQAIGMLGSPASHGCIRLAPGNAATFYSLVQKHGNSRTQISVVGSAPGSHIASRRGRLQGERIASESRRPLRQAMVDRPPYEGRSYGGITYIGPGSAYYGRDSFVHNGVRYVRVR